VVVFGVPSGMGPPENGTRPRRPEANDDRSDATGKLRCTARAEKLGVRARYTEKRTVQLRVIAQRPEPIHGAWKRHVCLCWAATGNGNLNN